MINVPERIKELLHHDSCYKNVRIHFPAGERTDICNDMIVKDSVSITESICSRGEIKLGLSESPTFECEVVGVENIKGCEIEVYLEIECESSVAGSEFKIDIQKNVYPIIMGRFIVDSCQRQSDYQHRRIVAYAVSIRTIVENSKKETSIGNEYILTSAYLEGYSNVKYSPSIIATLLDAGRCDRLVFDESEIEEAQPYGQEEDVIIRYSISNQASINSSKSFGLLIKPCHVDNWNSEYLLYFQLNGENNKTLKECVDEVNDEMGTNYDYTKIVNSVFGWRIGRSNYAYNYQTHYNKVLYGYGNVSGDGHHIIGYPVGVFAYYSDSTHPYGVMAESYFRDYSNDKIYKVKASALGSRITFDRVEMTGDVVAASTYHVADEIPWEDMFEAITEIRGSIGRVDRYSTLQLVDMKQQFYINPSESLFPGNNVKPMEAKGGSIVKEDYQTCWYDDLYTLPYGVVKCTYKNTNEEEATYIYYIEGFDNTSDESTYKTYEIKNNYVIRNAMWTESQIEAICQNVASSLSGVTYMPFELKGRGLPYVEPGDTFEVLTPANESITTIVLERTLSGEQVLTDKYSSK